MYEDHYGLSGRPFQLTPDARFWFDTATHKKAMAYLGYGLSQGEGFIVVTGDVGTGKTTLVGHLMGRIDREQLHVIQIVSTQIQPEELLRLVAEGMGLSSAGLTKAALLQAIERGLHAIARTGKRTLLIVDEAQALPIDALEELRMLSNFQAGGHALLQIFLLGQPEFRAALHGSDRLEQLRQRVIATHHLDPMQADEVEPYMLHRLKLVGWTGKPSLTPHAFHALHEASSGVPRRLNLLAGRVLLYGAIERLDTIDGEAIAAVLADVADDLPTPDATPVATDADPVPEPVTSLEHEVTTMTEFHAHSADLHASSEEETSIVDPAPDTSLKAVEPELAEESPPASETGALVEAAGAAPPVAAPAAPENEAVPAEAPIAKVTKRATVPFSDDDPYGFFADASDDELEGFFAEAPIRSVPTVPAAPAKGRKSRPAAAPADTALLARITALEERCEQQETALRRVLRLLVDWVEGDAPRPDLSRVQG